MFGDSLELVPTLDGRPNSASVKQGALADRRKRTRTRLHLPILIFRNRPGTGAVESTTRDLSSSGFYCVSRVQFAVGEQLICSLKIPTHDPNGKQLERKLECRVRVVRVVPQ